MNVLSGVTPLQHILIEILVNYNELHICRSLKAAGVNQRQRDQKKFLWYNLYSWLVPLILTVITIIIHDTDAVPDEFMPKIGKTQCFFETSIPAFLIIFFILIYFIYLFI